MAERAPKKGVLRTHLYRSVQSTDIFWPPRVVWGREQGWLNVRDPWGQWHSIPAKEAPSGWARLATRAKRGS